MQALSIYLFDRFSKNPTTISCVLFILYDKYVCKVLKFFGKGGGPVLWHRENRMADILRVTTPLVNKAQTPEAKRNVDLAAQFPLQDVSRVTKPSSQSELLSQNNGLIQQEETSALLLNLLKDPSVTVSFLKGISAMEAVIRLLPANNNPFTQELEQMFGEMLVPSDQIAQEMGRQESASTFFKGELFELLREAIRQNPEQSGLRETTVSFLKALTLYYTRQEALGSVANSLQYLSDSLSASRTLSQKLAALAARYLAEDAPESFRDLRQATLNALKEVQDSILFSGKTEKIVKMIIYNLSRYNDNGDFLRESVSRMLLQLHGDKMREQFLQSLESFLEQAKEPKQDGSSAMGALTRILERQTQSEDLMALNSERMEKIIYSLLSSPCNFTPLLHFVLPVQFEDLQSFAEIWINPNGEEDERDRPSDGTRAIHMLLSFEIDSIGHFELELFVREKVIDFSLFCPPAYASVYDSLQKEFRSCAGQTGYRIGEIHVDRLQNPRSLMDVFRSLPYKRTGVDVKI